MCAKKVESYRKKNEVLHFVPVVCGSEDSYMTSSSCASGDHCLSKKLSIFETSPPCAVLLVIIA